MHLASLTVLGEFRPQRLRLATNRLFVTGTGLTAGLLLLTGAMVFALRRWREGPSPRLDDFWFRWKTWAVLIPVILLPIALGAAWTIVAACALCAQCYREYARAVEPQRSVAGAVAIGLGAAMIVFAALLDAPGLLLASLPVTLILLLIAQLAHRPEQYVERVGAMATGFLICWFLLGYIGLDADLGHFRNSLFLVLFIVAVNDIAAYIGGQFIGRHALAPNLSPRKTIEGALAGMSVSVALVVVLGRTAFAVQYSPWGLAAIGAVFAIAGTAGDLIVSAVKRNAGVKDMGSSLPGLGGFLDRFDSMILAAPLMFYLIRYL